MNAMLEKIIAHKRREVEALKGTLPLSEIIDAPVRHACFDFAEALSDTGRISIIAEVKKASPSKGVILEDFDPFELARYYEQGGAAAISVLTDKKYFQGSGEYIGLVKQAAPLPVLCKEFILDPYQIYLARYWGADAVLLIVACLSGQQLQKYIALADELGLAALVEVHTREELQTALLLGTRIIGVNNRNLDTFETDLAVSEQLAHDMPQSVIRVSESGIFTRDDIVRLHQSGYTNFLIGESIVRSDDIPGFIRRLRGDQN